MPISRDEVLHVARLARLALTDDEIERLTDELGAILDAVGVVSELDLADVPPTSHPLDLVNVWADDEPQHVAPARGRARERARGARTGSSACRHGASSRHAPPHGRGGDRPARARRALGRGAPRRVPRRDRRAGRRAPLLPAHRRRGGRGRRADRAEGRHLDEGGRDDGRLEDPRRLRPRLRRDRRRARARTRGSRSSARRTRTSSRWDPRPRTRRGGRPATRGIPRGCPAAPAAARPRR